MGASLLSWTMNLSPLPSSNSEVLWLSFSSSSNGPKDDGAVIVDFSSAAAEGHAAAAAADDRRAARLLGPLACAGEETAGEMLMQVPSDSPCKRRVGKQAELSSVEAEPEIALQESLEPHQSPIEDTSPQLTSTSLSTASVASLLPLPHNASLYPFPSSPPSISLPILTTALLHRVLPVAGQAIASLPDFPFQAQQPSASP